MEIKTTDWGITVWTAVLFLTMKNQKLLECQQKGINYSSSITWAKNTKQPIKIKFPKIIE